MKNVILKPGREKSLLRRHPWIFSGAVEKVQGKPVLGETVEVLDSNGQFLARGAYSPESQIRVRVWSWDPYEFTNPQFFRSRLEKALALRIDLFDHENHANPSKNTPVVLDRLPSAVRLVFAESDGLPGLIVDRYEDMLVLQALSAGIEHWRDTIADLLVELTGIKRIYERSDAEVRKLEGLLPRVGLLRWTAPPERIRILENDLSFWVSVREGHKTGFYLDQRENRALVRKLAHGKDVLDCFCYSGGFTVNALEGGAASVAAVDSSGEALDLAYANIELNDLPLDDVTWIEADVFEQLRKFRDQARQFDLIVLDPPKFAQTSSQVRAASRAYKDINLLAIKLLRPGGLLLTFSCSGGVSPDLFQKIVAGAALDAEANIHIVGHLEQSPDHPVALNFPESAYLKGLILRKS